jgi:hypothetical protein
MRISQSSALLALAAVAAMVGSPASHAADNGFYLGAAVTDSKIDGIADGVDLDDTSFKIIAGLRPLDWLGFEANYVDLGSEDFAAGTLASASVDAKAYSAFAVGFLQLDPAPIDLYAKVGLARWELDGSVSSALGRFDASDDGTEFAYGGGIQARLGSFAVRAEYETFELDDSAELDLISVGFTWTFL